MNRSDRLVVTAGALALAISLIVPMVSPASAGGRVFVGVGVGFPLWGPFPYPYAYPSPWAYPAFAPPVVVHAQPPTFVQQEQGPASYWYYCQASQAYYPWVNECPGGWLQVVPQPAPPAPGAPPR
jgi:hypothetical protein